jgi:uncharacterized protein (UPF0264 family)
MKLLVSVESLEEARIAVECGCAVLDIKNPNEGSLGANFPWVLQSIMKEFPALECETSATVGDLPHKPGTGALAAYAVASLGLDYVKGGLYASTTFEQAVEMMKAIQRAVKLANPNARAVAAGFADWRRFNGLSTTDLVRAATASQVDVVLIDTAIKDGSNLFDNMSLDELAEFVGLCREAGIICALAGSIKEKHLDDLARIGPDLTGVRGALCSDQSDRRSVIDPVRTRAFIEATEEAVKRAKAAA